MNGLAVCGILAGLLYFLLFNMTCIYFILFFVSGYFILSWIMISGSNSKYNTVRRKVQISTWSDPVRPSIMGYFCIKVDKTLEFLQKASKITGHKITMTHLVIKAVGDAMKLFPEVAGKIVFGNYVTRKMIDASCLVTLDDGRDVYFSNIKDVPNKSLSTIAFELTAKKKSLTSGFEYTSYKRKAHILQKLPTCVIGIIIEIVGFITTTLSIPTPFQGANMFGNYFVTNVSSTDAKVVYAPLVSAAKCPVLFTITAIHDEPVVENSEVVVKKIMNMCATLDHRYIDGVKAIVIQNKIKEMMEDPEKFIAIG